MISLMFRSALLSLVLATGLAAPAGAGVGFWDGPNCADPTAVPLNFSGSYALYDKCEAMCRGAAAVCRTSAKSAIACMRSESAGYWATWVAAFCAPLSGAEKLACMAEAKLNRSDDKEFIRSLRDDVIAECDMFLGNCLTGCSMPVK